MNLQLRYCRFCAEQKAGNYITDLFKENEIRESVIGKVTACKISSVDFSIKSLPETICSSCLIRLNDLNHFLNKVKASQIILIDRCKINNTEEDRSPKDIYECCYSNFDNGSSLKQDCTIELAKEFDYNISVEFVKYNLKDNFNNSDNKYISDPNVNLTTNPFKHCHINSELLESVRDHCRRVHGVCNNSIKCGECDEFQNKLFLGHVNQHTHSLNKFYGLYDIHVENGSQHRQCTGCSYDSMRCEEVLSDEVCFKCHPNEYQRELENVKRELSKDKISTFKKSLVYDVKVYEPNSVETWKDYPWICRYCHTKFSGRDVLRSHVKEVHQKCFGYKCVDCTKDSKDFNSFVKHVREHRPNLTYHCEYCHCRLKYTQSDINHIDEHLLNDYVCKSCGCIFNNETELQRHVSLYNPTKKIRSTTKQRPTMTDDDLKCNICHKTYKNLTVLRAHKKLHTDRRRDYTCDRCGMAFFTKGALSVHCLLHEKPEPQTCLICKKSFLTLTRLKKHLKTHDAAKPFQCLECHRLFRLKEQLKGHLITHTNLVPFKCKYCEKAFKHKNVLKIHENQHTGTRPYSCGLCKMNFSNWSNCNKHMKRKHGATLAKNVMTPQGKLPLNPNTGEPRKMADFDTVKDWALQIMEPCKKGKKTTNKETI